MSRRFLAVIEKNKLFGGNCLRPEEKNCFLPTVFVQEFCIVLRKGKLSPVAVMTCMTGDHNKMPGLAQLIRLHKKKNHILRSVLDRNLENDTFDEAVASEGCTVLQDAIGHLRPDQLRRRSIPEAIAELREIGTINESSVETIMTRSETLMEVEPAFEDAMEILQACSFQDIAGQRLSKVTELLENLEERMHSLVHETGIDDSPDAIGEEEMEIERRRKELILHGPQLTGEGVSQDEIDALLGA